LKEVDFCSFNRFEQVMKEVNNRESFDDLLIFSDKKEVVSYERKEYQNKFAEMIHVCFNLDVTIINQLDLQQVTEQIERYELGEIWTPLTQVFKKSVTNLVWSQKVKIYQLIINRKLSQIKII
jgi:hypothetical protein